MPITINWCYGNHKAVGFLGPLMARIVLLDEIKFLKMTRCLVWQNRVQYDFRMITKILGDLR